MKVLSALCTKEKRHIEEKGCWKGPCLGHTGKRRAKRMLNLQKGRATVDSTK